MSRVGINPARGKFTAYRPTRVTAAVLTFVPHLDGYFRQRLDVLRLTLASLRAHAGQPLDLMVFDNGSCAPVVDALRELRDQGVIQYLLLSGSNIGKIGAFQMIFNAAPGELVAYCDDDIFFYPGWLDVHLRIMDAFPKVGMVCGAPVRNAANYTRQTAELLTAAWGGSLTVSHSRRIQDEWEADWASSTGRDPQEHLTATQDHLDLVVKSGEVEAIASGNHFQFLARKKAIQEALPEDWSGKLMGKMVELDYAVEDLGYLRLSTVDRCVRHIGNLVSPALAEEARALGLDVEQELGRPTAARRHWLLRLPGMGRVLRAVYNWIFNILHGVDG